MSEVVGQTQTLEQSLNKTDLGHNIYEYRKLLIAAVIALVVGTIGFVIWKQSVQSSHNAAAVEIFDFQTKVWTEAKAQKIPVDELMSLFRALPDQAKSAPLMLSLSLEMSKFLFDQGKFAEADEVLKSFEVGKGSAITGTFVAFQRSVILESLGKNDEAVALLEVVAQNKDSLFKPKLYLEIGRLSLAMGNKDKAKTSFEYVLNNYPNDEYAKLAKLYLSEVK